MDWRRGSELCLYSCGDETNFVFALEASGRNSHLVWVVSKQIEFWSGGE